MGVCNHGYKCGICGQFHYWDYAEECTATPVTTDKKLDKIISLLKFMQSTAHFQSVWDDLGETEDPHTDML